MPFSSFSDAFGHAFCIAFTATFLSLLFVFLTGKGRVIAQISAIITLPLLVPAFFRNNGQMYHLMTSGNLDGCIGCAMLPFGMIVYSLISISLALILFKSAVKPDWMRSFVDNWRAPTVLENAAETRRVDTALFFFLRLSQAIYALLNSLFRGKLWMLLIPLALIAGIHAYKYTRDDVSAIRAARSRYHLPASHYDVSVEFKYIDNPLCQIAAEFTAIEIGGRQYPPTERHYQMCKRNRSSGWGPIPPPEDAIDSRNDSGDYLPGEGTQESIKIDDL